MLHKRPILIVVAGPNGSGKTSLTSQVLKHDWAKGCEYINPDNIARDEFGDWNSPEAVVKAAIKAAEYREKCFSDRKSMAVETVLSAPDKIAFMEKCKSAGYFVRLFFVGTDNPTINAARVARRVMEGGHEVPIPKIISRYSKSMSNCIEAISIADRAYIYDNSVDDQSPKIMFRVSNGTLAKRYSSASHNWSNNILHCLPVEPRPRSHSIGGGFNE